MLNEIEVSENQVKESELRGDYLSMSLLINGSLLPLLIKFNKDGIFKDKIKFYKEKLKDVSVKSFPQMQTHSVEVPVDGLRIKEYINSFTSITEPEKFFRKVASIVPKNEDIVLSAKKTTPIMLQFCNHQSIDDEGNIKTLGDDSWYYQLYTIQQNISDGFLEDIFLEVISSGFITEDVIVKYIASKPFFPIQSDLIKFQQGIHNFFKGDYLSSIHILTPLFERVLLNICAILGLDTIAWLRGSPGISPKTVGKDFVLSDSFQKLWGVNIAKQLNFIMYDSQGYNIRNEVAHGEISYARCNFRTTVLIIYLYIIFAARIKVQNHSNT